MATPSKSIILNLQQQRPHHQSETPNLAELDFIGEYQEFTKATQVPRLFNSWASVIGISAVLSQQTWIKHSFYNVYPNLYVMLIGKPGTGKGTSCAILKEILDHAGYSKFAPNKTTQQKFLTDLESGFEFSHSSSESNEREIDDYFGGTNSTSIDLMQKSIRACSDVLILAEEFNNFMGTDNQDFISLLTELWSYGGTYRDRIKTGKSVTIPNPCVNLFGGNTNEGFSMAFPSKLLGQGFLARFILVYGSVSERSRSAFPDPPEAGRAQILGNLLHKIQGEIVGEYEFTSGGKMGAEKVFSYYPGPEDGRFEHYRTRRFVQFLKLCICFAASNHEKQITELAVIRANTLLVATEAEMSKALGEFGKSRNSEIANKIMQHLYAAHRPVTIKQIYKLIANDIAKYGELTDLIENLTRAEKIQFIGGDKKGEGGWLARQEMKRKAGEMQEMERWVDRSYYEWLREM